MTVRIPLEAPLHCNALPSAPSIAGEADGQVNLVRYGVPYIFQGGSVTLTRAAPTLK